MSRVSSCMCGKDRDAGVFLPPVGSGRSPGCNSSHPYCDYSHSGGGAVSSGLLAKAGETKRADASPEQSEV